MKALLPALVAVLAVPALAQGSFDLDKQTNGALGRQLTFGYANAPAARTMLFTLGATPGPFPFSLVDAGDSRRLDVGFDLSFFWFTLATGNGTGQVFLPIPNDARLAGLTLRFQGVTYPGTTRVFGALSNLTVQQLGAVDTPRTIPATLVASRAIGSVFRSGRDVVVAGGGQGSLLGAVGLASTEVYDGRTMTVRSGRTMNGARALAISVPLNDGRVLIAGGVDAAGTVVSTAEVYDPATGAFTPTNSMSVARAAHDGVRLNDGRVLVAGGTTTFADAVQALSNAQASVEIWSPTTGAWTTVRAMPDNLLAPDLTTLNDGRVLVSGGFDVNFLFGIPIPFGSVTACRTYSPSANSWTTVAAMNGSRGAHAFNTVRLPDGRVLVTGGARSGPDLTQAAAIGEAEIYDPAANSWTALPTMASPRALHSATVLGNGRVIVAGGADGTLTAPLELAGVQELDPATRTWRTLPPLVAGRAGHGAALTGDGLVLILGGQGSGGTVTLATIESIRP